MKNISQCLALALVLSMSLATVPSYAKNDNKDDKKEEKKASSNNSSNHGGGGGGGSASSSSSSHIVVNTSSSHGVSSAAVSHTSVNTSSSHNASASNGGQHNGGNNHNNNNNNNNNNSNTRPRTTANTNVITRATLHTSASNGTSVSVLPTSSGHGVATILSNKKDDKKDKNHKDKDGKDKKDKDVAHNPKDGGGKNKDKDKEKDKNRDDVKTNVATEPVPTHELTSEELKAKMLAMGFVLGYDGKINCLAKETWDMCHTQVATHDLYGQYEAALKREENQRQIDKATEAAKELEKLGIKAVEDAPYGGKIVMENGKFFVTDSVGNKFTSGGFGTVDEIQMSMRMWDIDPASMKEALDADLKKSEALVASGAWTAAMFNTLKERYDLAISSYERNPLVGYGNQFLLPASTFKNPDGSYQVPGTQKWIQNADKFGDAKSLLENENISSIGAHELYSRITRELPFDFEKILASNDPLGAFRAAYSAFNSDSEWRKIETAWKNHMALVANNKYVKVNHDVDTSGIVFDYAGNANNGEVTGTGFAGTGYEAGYLPGESTDNATYPGVQGDEPRVYDNVKKVDNSNMNTVVVDIAKDELEKQNYINSNKPNDYVVDQKVYDVKKVDYSNENTANLNTVAVDVPKEEAVEQTFSNDPSVKTSRKPASVEVKQDYINSNDPNENVVDLTGKKR